MERYVKFGEVKSSELGLILSDVNIGFPTVKENIVDVPTAHGSIDLTEYYGSPRYNTRELKFTFTYVGDPTQWARKLTEITTLLHGKQYEVMLDVDSPYVYDGRVYIDSVASSKWVRTIVIRVTAQPYKYGILSVISVPDKTVKSVTVKSPKTAFWITTVKSTGTLSVLNSSGSILWTENIKPSIDSVLITNLGPGTYTFRSSLSSSDIKISEVGYTL